MLGKAAILIWRSIIDWTIFRAFFGFSRFHPSLSGNKWFCRSACNILASYLSRSLLRMLLVNIWLKSVVAVVLGSRKLIKPAATATVAYFIPRNWFFCRKFAGGGAHDCRAQWKMRYQTRFRVINLDYLVFSMVVRGAPASFRKVYGRSATIWANPYFAWVLALISVGKKSPSSFYEGMLLAFGSQRKDSDFSRPQLIFAG